MAKLTSKRKLVTIVAHHMGQHQTVGVESGFYIC